jgi:hypothetical protein
MKELIINEMKATPANMMHIPTTFSRFVIGKRSPYPTVDNVVILK